MKLLTWKVYKTIPIPCPDYKPDPYTGEYPSTHCLVYHCKTITENKTAEFPTTKEAEAFAFKAPYGCYDFKLNGKSLKDKRQSKTQDIYLTGLGGHDTTTIAGTNILKANK